MALGSSTAGWPSTRVEQITSPNVLQVMQDVLLAKLTPEEAQEWQRARAEAEAEGTFFMAWPHHCTVGTKP